MKHNMDEILKEHLSIEALNTEAPDISLVNAAREKIKLRKQTTPVKERFWDSIWHFVRFELKTYQIGVACILIIGGLFYFINTKTQTENGILVSQNATSNYSISSSTVLASLTQYTNNKTATSSSTVLTSIITFVVRN